MELVILPGEYYYLEEIWSVGPFLHMQLASLRDVHLSMFQPLDGRRGIDGHVDVDIEVKLIGRPGRVNQCHCVGITTRSWWPADGIIFNLLAI